MDKEDFEGLMEGMREAADHMKALRAAKVKAIREKTALSQSQFAKRFHINVTTLRNWEQGRSIDNIGETLLTLIDRDPDAVARLLNA